MCKVCGAKSPHKLWVKEKFLYYKCRSCGLVFVEQSLTDEDIVDIYEKLYPQKQGGGLVKPNLWLYGNILKKLEAYRELNKIFDIGCFDGKFLVTARLCGWGVAGVDVSAPAVEYCNDVLGLPVFNGDVYDALRYFGTQDVITLFDVFEHLRDPVKSLREIYNYLRPGGAIYLETPNNNSFTALIFKKNWCVYFPWHFFYFNPKNLKDLFENIGFRVEFMQTTGFVPFRRGYVYEGLERCGNLRKESWRGRVIRKFREKAKAKKIVKILYYKYIFFERFLFRLLAYIGVNVGTKIIVVAVKPRY